MESLVVAARSTGDQCPVWSIHPIGGSVLWIRRLAAALPADQPLYGIQARGLDGTLPPHRSVPDMARHYLQLIRDIQPHGPYRLCGASFGGTVAFEMAQQLRGDDETVELLALFDTFAPGYPAKETLFRRGLRVLRRLWPLSWRDRLAYVRDRRARLGHTHSLTDGLDDIASSAMVRAVRDVIAANTHAMETYRASAYGGRIVLFRATDRPAAFGPGYEEPTNGWSTVAPGRVEVIPIHGDHRFLLDAPAVVELSRKFAAYLAASPPPT